MASIDISQIIETTAPAVPQIYAYTTPEIVRHNGWTKIGYTEQDVRERIKQQTHTADVQWHLEWSGNATWEHRAGTFHDTDFHAYLEKQGVEREPKKEWFKISGEESHQQFYRFRDTDGVLDAPGAASYTLRAEQQRAVEQTGAFARAHWDEGGAHGGEFLWNAKPRFGKTLTAYDLCRSIGAQKVLIVTNRPAIANSWYDDYVKFVGLEGGYRFISGVDALTGKPYCLSREEYLRAIRNDPEGPKGFIEFVSLQDLKGSIRFGGVYQKLDEVADLTWDVLIIDEAHEGVDTFKTDVAFDHIKRRFTLHLSGTPFKAIANEKFVDDAIYNWTYADEQQAKRDWPADSEQPNPYANLPKLNLLTYQMSDIVEQEARGAMEIDGEQTEFAFDLNEFFSTKHNGGFVHDADVDKFLDALTTQEKFPFSTPGLRDELRHTFWMLNRVDSARALAKKLQAHPVFKDYEVVLAAGDGKIDADDENEKSLDKVRRAIKDHDRTITLSVGQLTTGVTVPESTPVLLANETEAGPARPYSREKLCPILAFFVEEDEDTILRRICEVLAGEGAGHTFVLHAKDEAVVRRFALTVPVSRFLVNVPASLGGIGAETALFPALTLGCGAVGGSSSSNNIGPLDLINLRRVAWGSEKPEPQPETPAQPEPDSALIARLTEEILKKLR